MNLTHVGSEFRRFGHGTLPPIALTVITLLPLLFGGLFVWSYWDPIGRLDELPVAIVNSDTGADIDGERLNAGDQITEELLASGELNLIEMEPREARDAVFAGEVYFALELPTDFSQAVASAAGDDPHHATITTVFNNNNGLIASTLGTQATTIVIERINEELGSQVADKLLVGFNTIGEGMDKAADGAEQLADGSSRASSGAQQLSDGIDQLHSGAQQLDSGTDRLAQGAGELNSGLNQAASAAAQLSEGLTQLSAATDALGAGAAQISGGVNSIAGIAGQASQAQQDLLAPLISISAQLKALNFPPATDVAYQIDALVNQVNTSGLGPASGALADLKRLQDGAAQLAQQLGEAGQYRAGIERATAGSGQLSTGIGKLAEGSDALVVGINQLSAGTSRLVEGSSQLSVGAQQLGDGLVTLDAGNGELALKLSDGAQQVPRFPDSSRQQTSDVVSTPVVQDNEFDSLSLFGYGLAPFFISLGLFVGGIVTFMVLRPLQRRVIDSGMTPIRAIIVSYIPAAIIGMVQATIMFLVQKFALGLVASHEIAMWMSMMYIALVFQAMVLGINALLGSTVGRVISMALMSLQLVSSGGLYPAETQPAFLRWFHTIDPMTYSVNLLRQVIFHYNLSGDSRALTAIVVLAGVLVLFLGIGALGLRRARHWQLKDLHPEVSV